MSSAVGFATDTGNPMTQTLGALTAALLPTNAPVRTGVSMPTINSAGGPVGDRPTQQLQQALLGSISAQGGAGAVPFQSDIQQLFGRDFFRGAGGSSMAFIDASAQTTQDTLNDQPIENPIFSMPYEDRAELQIEQYMPLFSLRGEHLQKSPGFHAVATPVIINNIQARLVQAERDAQLFGAAAVGSAIGVDGKRRAVSAQRVARGRSDRATNARILDTLRNFGALSAADLHRKIDYLGPVTQVYDSSGSRSSRDAYANVSSERIFNYSLYSRGKIHNMFGAALEKGDQLYFSIGRFSRDQLTALGATSGYSNTAATSYKRKGYGGADSSAYVGMSGRAASQDAFVQIRGWSSREARQFMGDTSELDALKPEAQDRFYCEREVRAAVEYREYEYDPATDSMRLVDNLAEGVQEALNNVPDLVLENYLIAGAVIPVGTVKTTLPRRTTERAILNGHYDHKALALLPHIDIYQNAA